MSKVRFGLIGFGLWGEHHAGAIAKCADAELAAVAVRSEESQARAAAAHPTADVVTDYRALLDRDGLVPDPRGPSPNSIPCRGLRTL